MFVLLTPDNIHFFTDRRNIKLTFISCEPVEDFGLILLIPYCADLRCTRHLWRTPIFSLLTENFDQIYLAFNQRNE